MTVSRIRQLDEATANQIAAGEVVERPASVVKELLENALDAGATRITVEIEEGGTRLIRVTDDGHGMGQKDARLCLERHATSKIKSVQDLTHVATMGFRGEAIPSIASVSRFRLTTRPPDSDEAFQVFVEGGHRRSDNTAGAAVGTTIEVEDLFFNVPARKKFLKRPATEMGHISDTVTRLAIAHPHVAIRLKHGPKTLLDVPPASPRDPKGRLARILGAKVAAALHPIPPGSQGPVEVTGYAAEPGLTERTTKGQYTFVNGRFVKDRTIQHAIQEGYRTLMEKGRYPTVVLLLRLDPSTFDVNVHPQKVEVRFAQTGDVHRAVTAALRRTLLDQPWLQSGQYAVSLARSGAAGPAVLRDREDKGLGAFVGFEPVSTSGSASLPSGMGRSPSGPSPGGPVPSRSPRVPYSSANGPRGPELGSRAALEPVAAPDDGRGLFAEHGPVQGGGRFGGLEPVGQVLGTYLVCQGPTEMVVIDQHAAHERIAFQRMRAQRAAASVAMQPLLMPLPIELDEGRAQTAEEFADRLSALGFELAPFGGRTWLVKATPTALAGANVERLILDLLDELAAFEQTTPMDEQVDALLSCAACHSVVRAQDRLTNEEIRALLVQMDEIDFGAHCPHGRPVFVRWTSAELARMFHRT